MNKIILLLCLLNGISLSPIVDNNRDDLSDLDWWQHIVFYQIYPRSFEDSDGDGIGDLNGITAKLNHLKESGIKSTWLSPIFKSPMRDFGYDISDYRAIQDEYGTMEDFDNLIKKANELDIKIVLDFVPNHSSNEHEWFQKSVKREKPYDNYYIWHPGYVLDNGTRVPPNNWLSVFRGSAWQWNDDRNEYYFHQFLPEQPDLNYRDSSLIQAMKDVLWFWLEKGVYGFRVDAIPHLVEQEDLKDEPLSGITDDPNDWNYLTHIYTINQPETFDIISGWRETLNQFAKQSDNITRVMMTEVYADVATSLKYYDAGASFSFNFALIGSVNKNSNATDFQRIIDSWLLNVPDNYTSNWVMGNHDNDRIATQVGTEKIDMMNMLLLSLPGVAVTYNGEEIGMENGHLDWKQHQDPTCLYDDFQKGKCRDFERTPFQWDDSHMAGFTDGNTPWLPVDPSYTTTNLKKEQKSDESHYKIYTAMTQLRNDIVFQNGSTTIESYNQDNVLVLRRILGNKGTFVLISNLKNEIQQLTLESKSGQILIRSVGSKIYKIGDKIELNNIKLGPYETYMIKMNLN